MRKTLEEIAKDLKSEDKNVQLLYAFNGSGKTRLSKEFRHLIAPKTNELDEDDDVGLGRDKILYYNAFTEDLFYWDNDLDADAEPRLIIQQNSFTEWILKEQGHDQNIVGNFQRYTDEKLTPHFSEDFSYITFSFERGNEDFSSNIKISKGEESNFVWSMFFTLIEQVINVLNVPEPSDRETDQFDLLEYIFIDDPVSSLDDNHLIELAVDIAKLIKTNRSSVKFIITTHNPLFYNVLYNELNRNNKRRYPYYRAEKFQKYLLSSFDDGKYQMDILPYDSPFSYHLYLKAELESAIESGDIKKYHFNLLRNILEKTSTFLGFSHWSDLLPKDNEGKADPYEERMINLSSHSKQSGEEISIFKEDDKLVLKNLVKRINEMYFDKPKG